ncbi:MAG TPA: CHAD domain-containing protein [Steroidobacteraceae bacterium]|nr:CHAD domain-containing protein [Steroidobacteraceae bacterium]
MPFRILTEESLQSGVRRIAHEQVERALDELEDAALDRDERVHALRRRCKKVRGLLRLFRPALGDRYDAENRWYRDTARTLSDVRDAAAHLETFDALIQHYQEAVDVGTLGPVGDRLRQHADSVPQSEVDERLAQAHERLREGCRRIPEWRLENEGFAAVSAGLQRTYARGRSSMETAFARPGAARFHEWRKRVKYHRYHLRLLRSLWSGPIDAARGEAKELASLLGRDHDLAELRTKLIEGGIHCDSPALETLVALIDRRSVELREQSRGLGAKVYAEKPKLLRKRFARYWRATQLHDPAETRPDGSQVAC